MANNADRTSAELRTKLQDAVVKCSERGLFQSAKWAAELLNSLPPLQSETATEPNSPMSDVETSQGFNSRDAKSAEARLEAAETSRYLMAKSFFDCREYDRCAAVFLPPPRLETRMDDVGNASRAASKKLSKSPRRSNGKQKAQARDPRIAPSGDADDLPVLSEKALFLALYAKYMSGEKRKDEESEMILGPADGGSTVNRELVDLTRLLRRRLEQSEGHDDDGQVWLQYLYGIVLAKGKSFDEAKKWLLKSVTGYEFNWGAWQELGSLIGTIDELTSLASQLTPNVMSFIFQIVQQQELFQTDDSIAGELKKIKKIFPTSAFLKAQKALLYYHAKDFDKAAHTFSKIVASSPHRLDDLDTYSNILYVMDRRAHLAHLAQLTTATDKFRPETCCIVGNYYAMKSEHEKAIVYFRRALTLDRSFLSAWTLMGHEYVELKNTQAAIECYRRAVDTNRKDYRAWYGLGQTYEVLDMHLYALWYYQRAAVLAPYDPKMWAAVGGCLAKMQRPTQAVKAFKRALEVGAFYEGGRGGGGGAGSNGSSFVSGGPGQQARARLAVLDPDMLLSIAEMYDAMGEAEERTAYLELCIAQEEGGAAAVGARGGGEEHDGGAEGFGRSTGSATAAATGGGGETAGVGVTMTTSRARLWLTKIEMAKGSEESLRRAGELAEELLQDGWEIEEAKGMVKEIRARLETFQE